MKREILCTSDDCVEVVSDVAGIPAALLGYQGVELDRPTAKNPQEHIRIVNGTAARDQRCSVCHAMISEGSPCFAVTIWTTGVRSEVTYSDVEGWEFGSLDERVLNRVGAGPLRA